MDAEESCSLSLDSSDINDPMIVAVESLDSSKKRKFRAGESELLPLPKHFCLEKQASLNPDSSCPSSDIECAECSYAMEETIASDETSSSPSVTGPSLSMFKDSSYSTGSSISSSGYATSGNIDQYYSKDKDKTQEYIVEDLSHMENICPEFGVEDFQEVLNPTVGSYILSSARWSVNNQDSEEATPKPTIDQEFEQYFSSLMM